MAPLPPCCSIHGPLHPRTFIYGPPPPRCFIHGSQIVGVLVGMASMAGLLGRVVSRAPKYSLFDPAKEMVSACARCPPSLALLCVMDAGGGGSQLCAPGEAGCKGLAFLTRARACVCVRVRVCERKCEGLSSCTCVDVGAGVFLSECALMGMSACSLVLACEQVRACACGCGHHEYLYMSAGHLGRCLRMVHTSALPVSACHLNAERCLGRSGFL